ncbi:MAG: hypothetical protein ACYTG5_22115, partial [Planctomycetota bacterium]
MELQPFPPGPKAAVHLMFIENSLIIRLDNGEERRVEIPGKGIRVPFEEFTDLREKDVDWLMIEHRDIDMHDRGDGVLTWEPDMHVREESEHLIENKLVRLLSKDAAEETGFGEFCDDSRMIVEMKFDEEAILQVDENSDPVSWEEFCKALDGTPKLEVDGYLDGAHMLVLTAVIVEPDTDPDPKGRGNKSDMSGTILEILADEEAFRFQVLYIKKAGWDVPTELPLELKVFAGDTKIKWVPRMGRHTGHLPFSALEADMFV